MEFGGGEESRLGVGVFFEDFLLGVDLVEAFVFVVCGTVDVSVYLLLFWGEVGVVV
jgi:hypothetical protein